MWAQWPLTTMASWQLASFDLSECTYKRGSRGAETNRRDNRRGRAKDLRQFEGSCRAANRISETVGASVDGGSY